LTICDLDGQVTIVQEGSKITRLGKDVDSEGTLSPEAMQRTADAIGTFITTARSSGAVSIVLAGTSALRDAKNGHELVGDVKAKYGLDIEIITGTREASLAFRAIVGDPSIAADPSASIAVFDIGGGSTELVWGLAGELKDNVSLNIGAVRLTERHFHGDPPTTQEFNEASVDGAAEVKQFFSGKPKIDLVCGVGGTASTFAAIIHGTKDVHGKVVNTRALETCVERLRLMPLAQRKEVAFLEPERADIIVAGGAILLGLLHQLAAPSYRVSLRGMRYGLVLEQKAAAHKN
jgi:exopolyphosphatase/guanosine-5'-triphosphate,3'-diphosphate pyrophosphatase